jgi:uroporphyrin-III C-methyltransferase
MIPMRGSGQAQASPRALVLAAHGSRRHPEANALVRRLAETVRAQRLFDEVAVAFHQGEPRFDTVLDELAAEDVTVVPLLTSAGHYAEVVLPQALSRNRRFAAVRCRQTPPVGTHPGVASLVARRVGMLVREAGLQRDAVSLAIVGHGTRRHSESRGATLHLADTLRRRRVAGEVLPAFLDDDPPLGELIQATSLPHLIVVPFLMGGAHAAADIPELLGVTSGRLVTGARRPLVTVDQAFGSYPGLADIIVDLARRHAPPPGPRFRPRGRAASVPGGSVHLVGAGPGDPGLITVRGMDLLRRADVVVHDRLMGAELLGESRAGAQLIDAGKGPGHAPYTQSEINDLIVAHARQGRLVVRLKGGDPFVFGRGSEEVEACRGSGVSVEIVPGVSSATAAPAAAGIPVTARGVARSFTVVTGHAAEGNGGFEVGACADTLVILMGRANLAELAAQLIASGRDPATPAACIQSATTPEQRVTRATLATISDAADRDGLESPVVTVIGPVAAMGAETVELFPPSAAGLIAAG